MTTTPVNTTEGTSSAVVAGNNTGNTTGNTTTTTTTSSSTTSNYVYIQSIEFGWIPARVIRIQPNTSTAVGTTTTTTNTTNTTNNSIVVSVPIFSDEQMIQSDGGKYVTQYQEQIISNLHTYPGQQLPLQNVIPSSTSTSTTSTNNTQIDGILQPVCDMCNLPFLHEASILYNLKYRHKSKLPYTRTGNDIIIAINPYQWLYHLYTQQNQYIYSSKLVWNTTSNNTNTGTTQSTLTNDNNSTNANSNLTTTNTIIDPRNDLEPHVYETSSLAYKGLAFDNIDQSILVSGESGAGKTETVKILLNDIANIQYHQSHTDVSNGTTSTINTNTSTSTTNNTSQSAIVQRVLDSNPLLEAFGNAKTVRNDNSSRFGKYIQLQFHTNANSTNSTTTSNNGASSSSSCILAGSKCEVYLLEKSRIISHNDNERTFHIFYQLLSASDSIKQSIWSELDNTDNESFNYVGYTVTDTIENISDNEQFNNTIQSLKLIGIDNDLFIMLMRTLCIVLQLGNLVFECNTSNNIDNTDKSNNNSNTDTTIISSQQELKDLAELMGITSEILETSLTIRTIHAARNEIFKVPLNNETAKDTCDAFAKEIYAKTFLWLVRTINSATCAENNYSIPPSSSTGSIGNNSRQKQSIKFGTIGLLDIFGFESFTINRFEQLCINYANEKLQYKFTQDIFKSVQIEYEYEGIELDEITYDDNTHVLDLIEGRLGLIAFLNEECLRPGGNDISFVNKTSSIHKDNINNSYIRYKSYHTYEFAIQHYAGIVVYNASGFVTKNMDTLSTDIYECAKLSTNQILSKELLNESSMNTIISDHVADIVAHIANSSGNSGSPTNNNTTTIPDGPIKRKPPPKRAPTKIPTPTSSSITTSTSTRNATSSSSSTTAAGNSGGTSTGPNKKNTSQQGTVVNDTVWTKFKIQLSTLMINLSKTRTRYIRCIKPNTMKLPYVMQHLTTLEQLRCAGVVAAITISRSAFPNRLHHTIVLDRFKSLSTYNNNSTKNKANYTTTTQSIVSSNNEYDKLLETTISHELRIQLLVGRLLSNALRQLEIIKTDSKTGNDIIQKAFVLGKTRTYFRSGALEYIENERIKCLNNCCILLQSCGRKYIQQSKYQQRRLMSIRVQSITRMLLIRHYYYKIRTNTIHIQCWYRCIVAHKLLYNLRREYKATKIQTQYRIVCDKRYLQKWKQSCIKVQCVVRGYIQRPKYKLALYERKEEAKLENKLLALQRKLEEAEQRRIESEQRAIEDIKAAHAKALEQAQAAAAEQATAHAKALADSQAQAAAAAAVAASTAAAAVAPVAVVVPTNDPIPTPTVATETNKSKNNDTTTITVADDLPISTIIERKRSTDDYFNDNNGNTDEDGVTDELMSALSDPTVDDHDGYGGGHHLGISPLGGGGGNGILTPMQLSKQQQTLMDESGKMLEYLRKEVFKLRNQNNLLRNDLDLMKDNNQRLMDANASAGASFAALNQHAKILAKNNDKHINEINKYKNNIQKLVITQVELRDEIKMKQATYIAEVHSRLQYQKALTKIIDLAQDKCRDNKLVEEFLRIADYHESTTFDNNHINTSSSDDFNPNQQQQQQQQQQNNNGRTTNNNNNNNINTPDAKTKANDTSIMSSFKSFWS